MLIGKKLTPYGYSASIRYDVKNPTLHVIEENETILITGEAEITLICGEASVKRLKIGHDKLYQCDNLQRTDTYRVPIGVRVQLKSKHGTTVLIEDNLSFNKVNEFLRLPESQEDNPSSDDLNYIEEDD